MQKLLLICLLSACSLLPAISFAQGTPKIKVDGTTVSADPVTGVKLPIWLYATQTLAADQDVSSISVVEFTINGSELEFTQVLKVTTVQSVPTGKAWKVESVLFQNSATTIVDWNISGNAGTTAGTNFIGTTDAQDIAFKTNNLEAMRVALGGNVGIGTISPGAKLEVAGQVKITGGTPGANKVLTSDGVGLASWTTTTGLGLASGTGTPNNLAKWTSTTGIGNSIIIDNGTNVGIGAAPVSEKLEVNGRIKDVTGYVAPVGSIMLYGGSTAPAGWVLCNGASLPRTGTYADLFAILGTAYGSVDINSFSVPDMRQKFALGKAASGTGATLGGTGGAIDHTHTTAPVTLTVAQMPAHSHTVTDNGIAMSVQDGSSGGNYGTAQRVSGGTTSLPMVIGSTGGGGSHTHGDTGAQNPPYIVVNYIIKY